MVFNNFGNFKKWEVKARRINTLCLKGRIDGTVKFGNA